MNASTNNLSNFSRRAIKELALTEQINTWSYKELADYLILTIWDKEQFDSKNAVVLSRVINILFKIQENKDNKDNLLPNKNIKVPQYDKLSEGYDPAKIKN